MKTDIETQKAMLATNIYFSYLIFYQCWDRSDLRMVPTFVSAHTFCASHKAWFNSHAPAKVCSDVINYVIKYATKMKAKFFYCD